MHIDGGTIKVHQNTIFGKGGNTTNKSVHFLIFVSCIKYQMICRISIILYPYTYHIKQFDRYAALDGMESDINRYANFKLGSLWCE